jgi:hypothetical protein
VENQSIVSLTIISQIHFNELKSCVIRCQDLPGRLQALLPKDEKKCLKVLLAHGVGVIEFIGYTLILTSEQLVVLMLAEEEEATKAKLEKLRLIAPAQ